MGWTFYNSNGQRLNTSTTLIDNLDIDGATDIGAAIVDADLFIIDDGAGGTNRKTAASRLKTYIGSSGIAKGWASWDGDSSPAALRESFNVASLDDDGTGVYGLNWTVAMDGANYPSIGMAFADSYMSAKNTTTPFPAASAEVTVTEHGGGVVDRDSLTLVAFGDQ